MYYAITITALIVSTILSVLSFLGTQRGLRKLEQIIEKKKIGHTMVGGIKMKPILFYFGLLRCIPDWASKDQEAKEIVVQTQRLFGLLIVSSIVFVISLFALIE